MEDKTKEHLEQLSEIRDMMKESTQFLSLSGMSGVFAGILALVGAALVWTISLKWFLRDILMTYQHDMAC